MKKIILSAIVRVGALSFLLSIVSFGQSIQVPVDVQFPLLLKVLSFERAQVTKTGDEIKIGILYQKKYRTSVDIKDEIFDIVQNSSLKIGNSIVRCFSIDMYEGIDLMAVLVHNHLSALYITPLRAVDIEAIADACEAKHIISMTGVPEYLKSGITLGIGSKGGKPQILMNLNRAKAEGADFSSKVLNLAKIID